MKKMQTILIVDDTESNIDLLLNTLSDYDLIPALSGEVALEVVKNENIDLILLDIMMPNMDGYEVCQILKYNPLTKDIPIIFLTAKTEKEDIRKGFDLGAVDYLIKPFDTYELIKRVQTHLELRSYQKYLEEQVQNEIYKNMLSQQLMFQSSKQAALGEQIMHIAHQWKQPLSELASMNTLLFAKIKRNDKIDEENMLSYMDRYDKLTSFMSQTIDTFQNFYINDNEKKDFFIYDNIKKVLFLLSATLEYDNIDVQINSKEDTMIHMNENEFSQVLLSILNNARNIFNIRDIKNRKIFIEISNNTISIEDNGGGIDTSIINDIFSNNISNSNSTGIGLYLSKSILEKNNAKIAVTNTTDGAKFKIEIHADE